jgi:molecular chaperone IbpA
MTNLTRYTAADLPNLMDKITRNSIGLDEYFDRLFNLHETTSNYPPYNLIQVNSVESRLELALAGFKKKKFLFILKMENFLLKGKLKIRDPPILIFIEE